MREKRFTWNGIFPTPETEVVEKHIQKKCNEFIEQLFTDEQCKDFIIPDLDGVISSNIRCAIAAYALKWQYEEDIKKK
jgi:hypothetical protein